MLSPSAVIPVAAGLIKAQPAVYRGFSVRETTGGVATATLKLYDNASAGSGTLLASIQLAANADRDVELVAGVWTQNGIFAVITGTIEGSVRIG